MGFVLSIGFSGVSFSRPLSPRGHRRPKGNEAPENNFCEFK
jgi:hypothetical protein